MLSLADDWNGLDARTRRRFRASGKRQRGIGTYHPTLLGCRAAARQRTASSTCCAGLFGIAWNESELQPHQYYR
ncbi:hypothetical protein ACFL5O_08805 [Myxococcota bacterium]